MSAKREYSKLREQLLQSPYRQRPQSFAASRSQYQKRLDEIQSECAQPKGMTQPLGPSDIDKTMELRTEILQLREQLKEEAQKPNRQVFDLQKEKLEQNIEMQKMKQNMAEL